MAEKPKTWPEHEKMQAIKDKSQAIGEFLEWCSGKGWELGRWVGDNLWPLSKHPTTLIAEFYEIDLNKIEAEKRAMLDILRARNRLDGEGRKKEEYNPFCESDDDEEENDRDVTEAADDFDTGKVDG